MNLVSIELDGHEYSLDVDDLTGRELGTIERLRRDHGGAVGTVIGVLAIAKRRANEPVSEDELLDMKISRWTDKSEPIPPTPPPPADDPPEPAT